MNPLIGDENLACKRCQFVFNTFINFKLLYRRERRMYKQESLGFLSFANREDCNIGRTGHTHI